jgi:DNA-binding transcriptional regulator YdaS (Cro superfamily)
MLTTKQAIQEAVNRVKGQTALAKLIGDGVTQAHVWNWLNRDKRAPIERVIAIEKLTGVPRHELRPDIYPPEEYKKAS